MVAFICYPKEATICLFRSLWSLAYTGSRVFGIVAFCCLWVKERDEVEYRQFYDELALDL
jgi:hypothetical protein